MKVAKLMELLSRANPDDVVCVFAETGPVELTDVAVFESGYWADMAPKLTYQLSAGRFVGFGCPGEYEVTESAETCRLVFDLEDNKAVE